MRDLLHLCRTCGFRYPDDYFPWGEDGRCSSFDICLCCGVQFGYQDCLPAGIEKHRVLWIEKGCPWRDPEFKPDNWTWEEQSKNLELLAEVDFESLKPTPSTVVSTLSLQEMLEEAGFTRHKR